MTAIIDPDGQRCFLMPLDPEEVPKPRNLLDIMENLKKGAYDLDIEEIRHDTRVIFPALESVEGYGYGKKYSRFITNKEPYPIINIYYDIDLANDLGGQ